MGVSTGYCYTQCISVPPGVMYVGTYIHTYVCVTHSDWHTLTHAHMYVRTYVRTYVLHTNSMYMNGIASLCTHGSCLYVRRHTPTPTDHPSHHTDHMYIHT